MATILGTSDADSLRGTPDSDSIAAGDGNDVLDGLPGIDTLVGGNGDDHYVVDVVSSGSGYALEDSVFEEPNAGTDTLELVPSTSTLGGRYFTVIVPANFENLLLYDAVAAPNADLSLYNATGNDLANRIAGNGAANEIVGAAGADTLTGNGGNDTLSGGSGVDAAVFSGSRSAYSVAKTATGYVVSGPDGVDTSTGIERLRFADRNVAVDLADGEAAGNTVRIIGAAFGSDRIAQQPDWVGVGLALFDSGMTMEQVCTLVVQVMGAPPNDGFVNAVFQNVTGRPPTGSELALYVGLLQGSGGPMSQAQLLVFAAEHALTASAIGLAGLQQAGVDYI